jgi:hypothetical protein
MEASNSPSLRASVGGVGCATDGLGAGELKSVIGFRLSAFLFPAGAV